MNPMTGNCCGNSTGGTSYFTFILILFILIAIIGCYCQGY